MIKNVVQDIGGVGLYGIISLVLFFTRIHRGVALGLPARKALLHRDERAAAPGRNQRRTIS
jgi:hypothetical protein